MVDGLANRPVARVRHLALDRDVARRTGKEPVDRSTHDELVPGWRADPYNVAGAGVCKVSMTAF